jgi:hypothetical protein
MQESLEGRYGLVEASMKKACHDLKTHCLKAHKKNQSSHLKNRAGNETR